MERKKLESTAMPPAFSHTKRCFAVTSIIRCRTAPTDDLVKVIVEAVSAPCKVAIKDSVCDY